LPNINSRLVLIIRKPSAELLLLFVFMISFGVSDVGKSPIKGIDVLPSGLIYS
jgi:hypothetical protein